jgi:hypothetical protein
MDIIHLDSRVSQSSTRAVVTASTLKCTATSAPDVYAHAIWVVPGDVRQFTLHQGDGIFVPAGSTLTIWIFRKMPGDNPWTADFELDVNA